jgi:hypothetical protein
MENTLRIKMIMEEPSIHHALTMEQTTQLYPDLGCDELETLASFINKFLNAFGYPRYNKQYVFLESVTEEEYEYLANCLDDYRNDEKGDC